MKSILQILRGLTLGLPASVRALLQWLCDIIHRRIRPGTDQCDTLNSPVVRVPDPLIYDQYYHMSLGLPISWDNPDIKIFLNGVEVEPSSLAPATTYRIRARIWNKSNDAPVAELKVAFSYLSFGVATQSHPIGQTSVNLGVIGGPDHPAFAYMNWTTPAVPGHYCIPVNLMPVCATLLPAVAKLQEDAGEHLRAAVISSGDLESSRRMFGGCAIKIAATDDKGQAARLFRIPGIPSAVLIGPERTIASETVVGAQAVMNLLNQLARTDTLAARVTRHPRSGDAESPTPMVVVRT
jgi:hypothetical protein